MKNNYTSVLPSGLPRQTYINGVPRYAEVGEPADDVNNMVARLIELSQNLPNSPQDINAAPTDTPTFTGIATAVTASQGTATTQIATTEFVVRAIQAAVALIGSNTTTPLSPTIGTVNTSTAGHAVFSWSAPTFNGGSAVTGYTIYVDGIPITGVSGSTLTYNAALAGGSHTVYITAINAIGESTPSPTVSFSVSAVATVPNPPTGVNAIGGTGSATVSFTPPSVTGNSAITGYIVTSNGPTVLTVTGSSSPILVSGLAAGSYTFTVQALNSNGPSSPSVSTATIAVSSATVSLPAAPTNITATGGANQATVYFTAPTNNGGSPITRYVVTTSGPETITATGTSSPILVTGLTPGSYTFTVSSVNTAGQGPASTSSASVNVTVASTVPGAPTLQTPISAGANSETLIWTAPTNNGGSPIIGYNVYLDGVLVSGSITIPDAPILGVPNTSAPNQAILTWTAPANNGGSPITGYNVYVDGIVVAGGSSAPLAPVLGTPNVSVPNQVTLNWTVPTSNGGSVITGYNVYLDGILILPTGASVPSAPVEGVPIVSGTNAIISWTAPSSNGGSTIIGYNVYVDGILVGGQITAPSAPTLLTPDTSVPNQETFTWIAPTNNGGSAIIGYNVYVDGVLVSNGTLTVPAAPVVGVPNTSIPGQATFTWAAPYTNGGTPITGYNVRVDGTLE